MDRIRYHTTRDFEGNLKRHRIVRHRGFEGYFVCWTHACSGCSDPGDYCSVEAGCGCHECGYTGKRRIRWFMPFDVDGWERRGDLAWERLARLREYYWAKAKSA